MSNSLVRSFQLFSKIAAVIVTAGGLLALGGWILEIPAFTRIWPWAASMKPNAAIGFVLTGASLFLQQESDPTTLRRFGKLCAAGVLVIGLLTLAEYLFKLNFGIDQFFFPFQDPEGIDNPYAGRMSPATAFCFVLSGAALLSLEHERPFIHQLLAMALCSLSFVMLIGYLYGVESLYRVIAFVSVAFHTALSFFILSVGIFAARPAIGLAARYTADDPGGMTLRHLLPSLVIILVVISWLRLQGQLWGYYDVRVGVALMTLVSVATVALFIWRNACLISRVDRKRSEAEQALLSINKELEERVKERTTKLEAVNADLRMAAEAREQIVSDLEQMQNASLNIMEDLSREILQRKQAEAKLQEAMAVKSQFTSIVSHELRTPLTVIKESVNIVEDGSAGPLNDEQTDFLETAQRNIDRLARLINSVLDYQKLDGKQVEFNMVEGDLNHVIKETVEGFFLVAKNQGLNLKTELVERRPFLRFDQDKIIQVLTNLLNNALKFTEKGSITVSTEFSDIVVRVSVKDEGVGIRERDLPKLFQAFSQVSDAHERKTGGTGLGLAISRKIIDGHNGKMGVESTYGKGSTFYFILPIVERRERGNQCGKY